MNVGPWEHPDGSEAIQGRTRTVKYTKPLSIPVPFAPKEAQVTEVHKVRACERCSRAPRGACVAEAATLH